MLRKMAMSLGKHIIHHRWSCTHPQTPSSNQQAPHLIMTSCSTFMNFNSFSGCPTRNAVTRLHQEAEHLKPNVLSISLRCPYIQDDL